ncbi:hypothetical protein CN998_32705, partial [Bacillus cereus]
MTGDESRDSTPLAAGRNAVAALRRRLPGDRMALPAIGDWFRLAGLRSSNGAGMSATLQSLRFYLVVGLLQGLLLMWTVLYSGGSGVAMA